MPFIRQTQSGPDRKRLAGPALLLAPTAHAAVTETRTTAYVYDSKGQVLREP